ncbi:MAG TPA: hypothetical protein DDW52_24105 [Planctomycetaceae bacterium]|nr:hypothetical protein [Planctomycetaceae bacterium]
MPAIVKQTLLRTGDVDFTATSASVVDHWLVEVDERIAKSTVAELFVAVEDNPVPRATLQQLGSGLLICDRIRVESAGKNASKLWHVDVEWKELDQDRPESRDYPTPNNRTTNPEDWEPTWSSRTQVIFEPAEDAWYLDGYSGLAEQHLRKFDGDPGDPDADPPVPAVPPRRAPLVNSALQPFANKPEHRRLIRIWTIRWLRPLISPATIQAENKLNAKRWHLYLDGIEMTPWEPRTALIDSIDMQRMRWGYASLIELTMKIVVDPEGWDWLLLDQGTAARAMAGDVDGNGGFISPGDIQPGQIAHRQLVDAQGRGIQDPVMLDGDGQPLDPGEDPVYGRWSDFVEVDFKSVPLLRNHGRNE